MLALDADLNLLLGDYLDSTPLGDGRARARDVARELARLPRALAVLGNHDWRAAGPAMGWALRDAGAPRARERGACRSARGCGSRASPTRATATRIPGLRCRRRARRTTPCC